MTIVPGIYLISWVPSVVFYSVLRPGDFLFRRIQPWINSAYYLSAVFNPFIYGVRSEKFRREVRRLANKLCPIPGGGGGGRGGEYSTDAWVGW